MYKSIVKTLPYLWFVSLDESSYHLQSFHCANQILLKWMGFLRQLWILKIQCFWSYVVEYKYYTGIYWKWCVKTCICILIIVSFHVSLTKVLMWNSISSYAIGLSYQQACIFISIFENVFGIDYSACALINLYSVFYINMYGVFFEEK